MSTIGLVGEFIIDVTLPQNGHEMKLRAGGIMHAARALWAIGHPYTLNYIAPQYLESQIHENAEKYDALEVTRIGTVTGSPNVILITEAKEVGNQGYEMLLRDSHESALDLDMANSIVHDQRLSDVIVFPGGFDLEAILRGLGVSEASVHIDANFECDEIMYSEALGRSLETFILSTSSSMFLDRYSGSFERLRAAILGKHANGVLLKENRGGSRYARGIETCFTGSQTRPVQHSVGVGDCFNAAFVALRSKFGDRVALSYASCIAAEYASTTYPEVFRASVQAWLSVPRNEIVELKGISLPWESRQRVNVYVAAPDFSHVDRRPIDRLADSLVYHNFRPRLPVRENGQMGIGADHERRQRLCEADLDILSQCQLMVAVMIYDDPGTLIEIGIAVERGIPVVVYDPFSRADNLMLTQLPELVSSDLDEVISKVFDRASKVDLA